MSRSDEIQAALADGDGQILIAWCEGRPDLYLCPERNGRLKRELAEGKITEAQLKEIERGYARELAEFFIGIGSAAPGRKPSGGAGLTQTHYLDFHGGPAL